MEGRNLETFSEGAENNVPMRGSYLIKFFFFFINLTKNEFKLKKTNLIH
jgi:hypothetical protein